MDLETDAKRLVRTGTKSLVVALIGFALPLALDFSLGYWVFGMSSLVSLFIDGTLTATSIGITIRVLADLKRQHTPEGQIVLGRRYCCPAVVISRIPALTSGWTNIASIHVYLQSLMTEH